jgi:hypothetical protein
MERKEKGWEKQEHHPSARIRSQHHKTFHISHLSRSPNNGAKEREREKKKKKKKKRKTRTVPSANPPTTKKRQLVLCDRVESRVVESAVKWGGAGVVERWKETAKGGRGEREGGVAGVEDGRHKKTQGKAKQRKEEEESSAGGSAHKPPSKQRPLLSRVRSLARYATLRYARRLTQ